VLLAGPGSTVAIHYELSEPANALVYLGNHLIIRGRPTRQHDKVKWAGTLDGRRLPAGTYVLSVAARDAAGNETPAAGRQKVRVVLRYVAVTPRGVSVRAGRPFTVHVHTAAPRYTWRLAHTHGSRRGRLLRLHAPTTPGTYRLVVTANGQPTTALVRVHAK